MGLRWNRDWGTREKGQFAGDDEWAEKGQLRGRNGAAPAGLKIIMGGENPGFSRSPADGLSPAPRLADEHHATSIDSAAG